MRTILGLYAVQDTALSATRLCHITGVIHFAAYKSVVGHQNAASGDEYHQLYAVHHLQQV
jgi:hypothetical protein